MMMQLIQTFVVQNSKSIAYDVVKYQLVCATVEKFHHLQSLPKKFLGLNKKNLVEIFLAHFM